MRDLPRLKGYRYRMPTVNLDAKLAMIGEHWSPRTVATVNDYDVRLVKVQGEFVPHRHADTDEFFLVLDGELTIRMAGGDVTLGKGEMYVVPAGVEHQPVAERETAVMLFEPSNVVNTGDAGGDLTAPRVEL
jgi:mannose-6-phosphate isomerase-like protein (cupin superfamily)